MFLVEYGPAMSAMSGKGTNVFFLSGHGAGLTVSFVLGLKKGYKSIKDI